jgi:ZIP family zinc transporter
LHNLPEGFAVAFSAFTDIAPIMVLAIGLHNIPEGLICAAPFYAATGSKWKVRWFLGYAACLQHLTTCTCQI